MAETVHRGSTRRAEGERVAPRHLASPSPAVGTALAGRWRRQAANAPKCLAVSERSFLPATTGVVGR